MHITTLECFQIIVFTTYISIQSKVILIFELSWQMTVVWCYL